MTKPKVLITGASGLIGRLTIENLSDKYEFSGLNRRPVAGIPSLQADINDAAAIKPAFQGMDMVLHSCSPIVLSTVRQPVEWRYRPAEYEVCFSKLVHYWLSLIHI